MKMLPAFSCVGPVARCTIIVFMSNVLVFSTLAIGRCTGGRERQLRVGLSGKKLTGVGQRYFIAFQRIFFTYGIDQAESPGEGISKQG